MEETRNGHGWNQIVEGFTPPAGEERLWWNGRQILPYAFFGNIRSQFSYKIITK